MNIGLLEEARIPHGQALARAGREVQSAPRFICAGECSATQTETTSERFFPSVHDGCPGDGGRQDIFPIAG
jgi:hypothetical protein